MFRSAAAYVVTAWLLVEIADVLLPIYDAPGWLMRLLVTLLLVGFTPAMIFTWLFNLTGDGIEATEDVANQPKILSARWFRATVGVVTVFLTGLAVWWVWTGHVEDEAQRISNESRRLSNPVVAVATIRNLSGNPELDWLSEGMANLVRTNLAQSRHLVVVSKARWDAIGRLAGETDAVPAAATEAGVDFVVTGEFISTPAGLYLAARLTDLQSGIDRVAESFDALTPETMLGTAYRIGLLARKGLQVPHTDSVDSFAADFVVNHMTAYEAYVGGLDYFRKYNYEQAGQSMNTALELAPQFHIARYRLAHVQASTGRKEQALASLHAIPADARLNRRERLYVDAATAFFTPDFARAAEIYEELLEEFPYEVEARQFLAEVYFNDYKEEQAIEQLEILARQEPENEFVWSAMATYQLMVGQLDDAENSLQRYLEVATEREHPLTLLGDLDRQRGKFAAAAEDYREALAVNREFTTARLGMAQVEAIMGNTEAAKTLWRDIVSDAEIIPDDRIFAAFDLSSILRSEGLFDEAAQPLLELGKELHEEKVREAMAYSTRATLHLEMGDFDTAAQLIDVALERNVYSPTRYLFARGLLEIARGDAPALRTTVAEILTHALPAEDPDRTEEKAALYLEGMMLLASGKANEAVEALQGADRVEGYRYALYQLGLAAALAESGQHARALALAQKAETDRDPGDVRLDLEIDRVRAILLQARCHASMGDADEAARQAERFLQRWHQADAMLEDIRLARALAKSGAG